MTRNPHAAAENAVSEYLDGRLDRAGPLPGLREATVEITADVLAGDAGTLMERQLRRLLRPRSTLFPDAYLADQAAAEDALQHAAAGMRSALAGSGQMVSAVLFEQRLSDELSDDPELAVCTELARVPRPDTRPTALAWSLPAAPWTDKHDEADTTWPPADVGSATSLTRLPGGAVDLARVVGGRHNRWVQIGMIERHRTPPMHYPTRPARQVLVMYGVEIERGDPPSGPLPFTRLPWRVWTIPSKQLDPDANPAAASDYLGRSSTALIGVTDGGQTDPGHLTSGLGTPPFVLAPILAVVAVLDLRPTDGVCGLSLSDDHGPAIVSRQWRAHLVHDGNYEPLVPAVYGTDVLVRPDAFDRLVNIIGADHICVGVSVSHAQRADNDPES